MSRLPEQSLCTRWCASATTDAAAGHDRVECCRRLARRRSSTAERLSCKQGVTGSSPVVGSMFSRVVFDMRRMVRGRVPEVSYVAARNKAGTNESDQPGDQRTLSERRRINWQTVTSGCAARCGRYVPPRSSSLDVGLHCRSSASP